MGKPFFGQEVQRQRDPRWIAYSSCALSQCLQVAIRIFARWRFQELGGKPQDSLGFVRYHQFFYERLEIGEYFDLRQRLFFHWIHRRLRDGVNDAATVGEQQRECSKLCKRAAARQPDSAPRTLCL